MFALLTRRIASRLGTSAAVRGITRARVVSTPAVLPFQSRRSFLTGTPRIAYATAAASAKVKTTPAKKPAKKTTIAAKKKKTTATKSKAKPKRKIAVKKKKVVTKKPVKKVKKPVKPTHPKITLADMPPRVASSPYIIFYLKYLKGLNEQAKPKTVADVAQCARNAGAMWKAMSEAEKQPYREEGVAAKAAGAVRKQAYFDALSAPTLTAINKYRKSLGKLRIHRITRPEDRKPVTSFMRYLADFRTGADASAILANESDKRKANIAVCQKAGVYWNVMSDAEKAPYSEATTKEFAAWKSRPKAHA